MLKWRNKNSGERRTIYLKGFVLGRWGKKEITGPTQSPPHKGPAAQGLVGVTSLLLTAALPPHPHTSFESLEKQPKVTSFYQTQERRARQNSPFLKYELRTLYLL